MKITVLNRRWFVFLTALIAVLICMALVPDANAAEPDQSQASYSVQQTDEGIRVSLDNATFRKNTDGSVSILSAAGNQIDSLSATYRGNGIEYRLVGDSELIATRGHEAAKNPFSKYRQHYFDGGKYAECIAWNTLKSGVTVAVGSALTGPGAAAGMLTGLVGGLVWNPIGCLRNNG